jgi:hypothetical protein
MNSLLPKASFSQDMSALLLRWHPKANNKK